MPNQSNCLRCGGLLGTNPTCSICRSMREVKPKWLQNTIKNDGIKNLEDLIQTYKKLWKREASQWIEANGINNPDGTKMSSGQIEAVSYAIRRQRQRFDFKENNK